MSILGTIVRGRAVVVTLTNKSGGAVAAGDVVITDTTADSAFTTGTTQGDELVAGVVLDAEIADDAEGRVVALGNAEQVKVTGTVNRGDFLEHSTTDATAQAAATYGPGCFAIAQTGDAGGYCSARLFPVVGDAGAGAPTDADYLVKTANAGLSAERVVTDTTELVWDWGTAGQAKVNLADNTIVAARLAATTTKRLFGRDTAGAGAGEEVSVETALGWKVNKVWNPDYPPAAAGALDDEFADASAGVPGGWTEYDHGSKHTIVEAAHGLEIQGLATAGGEFGGIYKADPTGNITVWAKVGISAPRTAGHRMGIAWLQDATSSSADVQGVLIAYDNVQMYIMTVIYTAYNVYGSAPVAMTETALGPMFAYLRMRRTGTTYAFDWSMDGIAWMRLSSGALSFTPAHIGIVANNNDGSNAQVGHCKFFRSTNSDVGIGGVMGGQRI